MFSRIWELIGRQYDELIKFATALRLGVADAESILRRFTKNNVQHPTYKALCELGKALKTMFLCDYLRLEPLRREIHEGLQVIENWNSANAFIVNAARSTPTRAPNSPEFDRLLERPVNELETECAPACPGLEYRSELAWRAPEAASQAISVRRYSQQLDLRDCPPQ